MTTQEIAKEIVIAMINKGSILHEGSMHAEGICPAAINSAKAVAAAYETVFAGLVETNSKSR